MTRDDCHEGDRVWQHRGKTWQRVRIIHMGTRTAQIQVEHNGHRITKPYEQLHREPKTNHNIAD